MNNNTIIVEEGWHKPLFFISTQVGLAQERRKRAPTVDS